MSSTLAQVKALIAMRWRMVRSRRSRNGLASLAVLLVVFVLAAVTGGQLIPLTEAFNAALLAPTAFLVYAALAIVGPAAAGGGNEMFPADDVVPHPVRPSTRFFVSVLLAPLNIAWVTQTTALLALASYVAGTWSGLPAALAVTVTYVAAITVFGQAVAWSFVGARLTRLGRRILWAVAVAAAVGLAVTLRTGPSAVLDRSPTKPVVLALLNGAGGNYRNWGWLFVALLGVLGLGVLLGIRAVAFTDRRPTTLSHARQARRVTRRRPAATLRRELNRIDRASVWRATSLRRGVLVMGVLPGSAAALVRVDWTSLALTSGLVAAGAGLLFGVNAFCLDSGGALWLGSLPLSAREHAWSKARVLAEICLVCCLITVAAGAVRARETPSVADVITVLSAMAACTTSVVAFCMRSSVDRPHRAELRGGRDTPAPPGAMAVYSARLALSTTMLALLIAGMGATDRAWPPALLAMAFGCLSLVSLRQAVARYEHPSNRAFVLVTVAAG